jgi:hypothetical protein
MIDLHPADAALIYNALLQHDGRTLCPDWPREQQAALTEALDRLKGMLRPADISDAVAHENLP